MAQIKAFLRPEQIKEPRRDYTDVGANGSLIFSEMIHRFDY